jgi:NAD(P)H-nitrite reductase large subunit
LRLFALELLTVPRKLWQAAMLRAALAGARYRTNCWVEAAEGDGRVNTVRLRAGDEAWNEACDYAAVAYGFDPNAEVPSLLGCKVGFSGAEVNDLQQTSVSDVYCAGECTGIGGVELSLIEGEIAGYAAAGNTSQAQRLLAARQRARIFADALNRAFQLRPEVKQLADAETIVCRCEDVTSGRLQAFSSFRAAKLHARCGMGACQGRICGTATKVLFGWESGSVRPPVFPASVSALAEAGDTISQEAQGRR